MCINFKRLTIRLAVALLTFSTSVALTILWILPSYRSVINPTVPTSSELQKRQETPVPDSWKQLRVQESVTMRIPQNMESVEPFGDHLLHVEAYGNEDVAIMIFYDPRVGNFITESQKRELDSCEWGQSVREHPLYRESTTEIDGKKAIIGISRPEPERIVTAICFPVAENVKVPLRIVAHCSDDRGLETAQRIFRSVTFLSRFPKTAN